MIKAYDKIKVKSTGKLGTVIEIDDNGGTDVPIYLVELDDKPKNADVTDVVKWYEHSEIEESLREQ